MLFGRGVAVARTATLPAGNRFGKYVSKMRKRAGLTQAALAHALATTGQYVSRLETGASGTPNAISLLKMADALDVPLSTLLVRGGLIEKCRYPEHLDAANTALHSWRSVLTITESIRVVHETVRLLCDNENKLNVDYRHLLKPLKQHAERLRHELRVTVDAHPID